MSNCLTKLLYCVFSLSNSAAICSSVRNPKSKSNFKSIIGVGININQKDTWNLQHCHMDRVNFLSGVYYVTVPKGDCGEILFHDPRGILANSAPDTPYYTDGIPESTKQLLMHIKQKNLKLYPLFFKHDAYVPTRFFKFPKNLI